jgi:hypothetical protein
VSVPHKSEVIGFRTNADLSDQEYRLVKRNGDSDMDLCGAGELPFGALTNDVADCSTTERSLGVQIGGPLPKIKCGGIITAGQPAMSDANGEAVLATDGNWTFGQAMETHADGDLGIFTWSPSYLETT